MFVTLMLWVPLTVATRNGVAGAVIAGVIGTVTAGIICAILGV